MWNLNIILEHGAVVLALPLYVDFAFSDTFQDQVLPHQHIQTLIFIFALFEQSPMHHLITDCIYIDANIYGNYEVSSEIQM